MLKNGLALLELSQGVNIYLCICIDTDTQTCKINYQLNFVNVLFIAAFQLSLYKCGQQWDMSLCKSFFSPSAFLLLSF